MKTPRKSNYYCGWEIIYTGYNFIALKLGISLNAPDKELLCRMIDLRAQNTNLNVR